MGKTDLEVWGGYFDPDDETLRIDELRAQVDGLRLSVPLPTEAEVPAHGSSRSPMENPRGLRC